MQNGIFLETDRLLLKPLCLDDFENVLKLRSCQDVMKHINGPQKQAEVESFVEKAISYQKTHGLGFSSVFLKKENFFIGQAGLFHVGFYDKQPEIELGYRFHKSHWGKGYATECAEALLLWAENNLKKEKVVAFVKPGNPESKNVLNKIGFNSLGLQESYYGLVEKYIYTLRKNQGLNYDNIAKGFANMRTEFATDEPYVNEFITYLNPSSHVLDVGCGSGIPIAKHLIERDFKVTGVDGSKKLLEIAKINVPHMLGIYSDIREFYSKTLFDGIIEWWCLFHLPVFDQFKMLEKFYQWLKPGGILQFTSGAKNYRGRSNDMLDEYLLFFSADYLAYEEKLKELNFKIISCQSDQENHLVWLVKK
jgi:SAM-dependent methyltransferase